ncbi:MAG: tripartite tricarboxylate transporter substrate binding protein [Desulfobacterales bacterium]|nr:tripartite tricarboxylate transporter substrate binding protein [Desulfobacterales bacterium]
MRTLSKWCRLKAILVAAVILSLGSVTCMAADEKFPSDTIKVIIHTTYGGGTDITARMMTMRTRRVLDVDMQVMSKRGGSGAKAHQFAQSQPKDGYTMLALTQSHLYTIARGKSVLKIDDLVGVARAMDDPTFITLNAKSNLNSLEDIVAASKEKPLSWGVSVLGSTEHIGLAQLAEAAGFEYKAVPFESGGQMVNALMSGAIDATLPNVSEARQQIMDGTLKAVAVMSSKRLSGYPDIPTTYEKGYEVDCSTTRGYAVLKGTPEERIKTLSDGLVKGMSHSVFGNYLASSGLTIEESVAGHEVWDAQLKKEYAKAVEAVEKLGFK